MKRKHSTSQKILLVLLFVTYSLNYKRVRKMLTRTPVTVIEYVINQSTGTQQNRTTKALLGNVFIYILDLQEEADHAVSLKVCACAASTAYFYVFKFLKEIFDLLNNRTYNFATRRYDAMPLKIDQTVLLVFLFSVLAIVFFNLVLFYLFFVFAALIVEPFEILLGAAASGCPFKLSLGKEVRSTVLSKRFVSRFIRGDLLNTTILK